jgi:hypothetical protein
MVTDKFEVFSDGHPGRYGLNSLRVLIVWRLPVED